MVKRWFTGSVGISAAFAYLFVDPVLFHLLNQY